MAKIFKSFLVLLVFANYLFLSGMGFISRPEQDPFIVLIQNKAAESHHYQSRRYMRTDGLEAFMAEALTTRYREATAPDSKPILSIAVNAHTLPDSTHYQTLAIFQPKGNPYHYAVLPPKDMARAIYFPPEIRATTRTFGSRPAC